MSPEDIANRDGLSGGGAGRFFSSLGHALDPRPLIKSAVDAVRNPGPVDPTDAALGPGAVLAPIIRSVVGGQVEQGRRAVSDVKQGRYLEAGGRALAAAIPVLGPAAAAAGEQGARGDIAGAVGSGLGLVAPVAAGAVLPKSIGVRGMGAADAEAVALAERAGVPVDAATATGNKFIKAVQHVSDRSLAGSLVAENAGKAQQAGLATLGEQLAAKAHGRAVTGAEAGSAAQHGVSRVVSESRAAANAAYGRLRAIEEAAPDAMTVDVSPVMQVVAPIMERLAAKKAVTGVLMGAEGKAAATLQSILEGPPFVPLSVADAVLSDLKAMARTNHPDLRSVGQGLAARAVGSLHEAVRATAKAAGPDAAAALNEGRIATKAKYAAADVLKRLEGAQRTKSAATAFRGLTSSGDISVGHLADTIKQAPATKPLIARAVLDGLIEHPTAGAAKTWSDWQKIGPETKALLYAPEHVKELDAFFKLRKMMADNPNPSGTAHTLLSVAQGGHLVAEPLSGAAIQIGAAALSKLLHSRAGVRLLTRGMRIPVKNQAASAAWATDFAAATSPTGRQPSLAGAPTR